MDRKAAMLEKERRFREQEEKAQEDEAFLSLPKKRPRGMGGGMQRLGPVMPREDDIPQFLPAPMQVPAPKPQGKMEIKISQETVASVSKASAEKAENDDEDDDDDDDDEQPEDQVLAFLRMEKAKKTKAAKPAAAQAQDEAKPKPVKKKRKPRKRGDGEGEEWAEQEEDELGEEDDNPEAWLEPQHVQNLMRQRDGGVSKQMMVIDSVKGKVSTANRNFTDADLERRFSMQEQQAGGHGSLMSEEQVLKMLQKEKQDKPNAAAGSATRRVQRELAEWAAAKEQQRQRVKSPHRFERMVVSRK